MIPSGHESRLAPSDYSDTIEQSARCQSARGRLGSSAARRPTGAERAATVMAETGPRGVEKGARPAARGSAAARGNALARGGAAARERRRAVAELRALAHPLRLRLFELFAEAPRTTMQVAVVLGEPPTRLYHHVNALERAGLLRLRGARPNRGAIEKY